jgi:cytochrome c biogenesis protein CcmG/thiol:disulfide interchange protein DsbE
LLKLQSQGIPIYGVNYKDTAPKARGFLAELGDPFTRSAADPSGRTGIDWGLYGVPETFLIGKNGQVILRHPGPITNDILVNKIAPAIAEAQK